jgi:hypothetical protein
MLIYARVCQVGVGCLRPEYITVSLRNENADTILIIEAILKNDVLWAWCRRIYVKKKTFFSQKSVRLRAVVHSGLFVVWSRK